MFNNVVRAYVLNCCSRVRLFATPWTVAHQAPLSMGFSRQEYWSALPLPPPGDLQQYVKIHNTSGFSNTWTMNFQMFKLVLEKEEEPEIKLPTSAGSWKKQESTIKTSISVYWLCQSLWLCGSQQTVENSERDGNTRPPDLPLQKPVCRSGSNS